MIILHYVLTVYEQEELTYLHIQIQVVKAGNRLSSLKWKTARLHCLKFYSTNISWDQVDFTISLNWFGSVLICLGGMRGK